MWMAPDFARAIHMNNEQFPFQKLDSYRVAREFARRVHEAKIKDAELRDQATRAAKSAFLGLCEGLRGFVGGREAPRFAGCGVTDGGISPVRDASAQAGVTSRSTSATSTRMDRHTMGTKQMRQLKELLG